jgi:hypothetical protein
MERLNDVGIEVVVLADHNDASWTHPMVEAGRSAGITVFPGVEVTSGSGADGAHIIIIGDTDRTASDFNELLAATCGFGSDHPRFDPVQHTPASSPRTLIDILDDLPDGYLAVGPHAFNENGVASRATVRGDLRWKILHHARLGAIDVGDVRQLSDPSSWHARFASRELTDFPCLPQLAFVSTSDAYSLNDLGSRWTWIRMSSPSLEGLRQAFLDHEARIMCDWDSRLRGAANPNDIAHAWVETIELAGLSTSRDAIRIDLHPRLNVLIGGRGSGKSTVVAGLRCLYGDAEALPPQAREEARGLLQNVFPNATLTASHRLPYSGEAQTASWSEQTGSVTRRSTPGQGAGVPTPTDFKVRIINQKELFERAAHSTTDPHATSRNLLALVDDALATGSGGPGGPAAFDAALNEAQTAWISAARAHQAELEATAQRDVVHARVGELTRQVAAFDSPENRARREANEALLAERDALEAAVSDLGEVVETMEGDLAEWPLVEPATGTEIPVPSSPIEDLDQLYDRLHLIRSDLRRRLVAAIEAARKSVEALEAAKAEGPWGQAVAAAEADTAVYLGELAQLGVDPEEYERLKAQLATQSQSLKDIDKRLLRLPDLAVQMETAWAAVEGLLDQRRAARQDLLDEVADRSQLLRFAVVPHADVSAWVDGVRQLLNLRADGFLADVPDLGRWLWAGGSASAGPARWSLWRTSCVTGDFTDIARQAGLRASWAERLSALDEVVRARLGSQVADDVVGMEFLIEDGDPSDESDWKALTAGSPGQRSAAMLSFVLHHGVDPLVFDQPEDDLDTEWITQLVVRQLRISRWERQLLVITHNANIPVNADAERIIVLEAHDRGIRVRTTSTSLGTEVEHTGALEDPLVRQDVQQIMEGGVAAFVGRELRYNNELNSYRAALRSLSE